MVNEFERRPWGTYEVLYDGADCKVKKIVVDPQQRPSYQYHHKRSESWTIVSGEGECTIEDAPLAVKCGDTIRVPVGVKHTIKNVSESVPLVFIEVQTGAYFGEDDIVRLEDKYGRA